MPRKFGGVLTLLGKRLSHETAGNTDATGSDYKKRTFKQYCLSLFLINIIRRSRKRRKKKTVAFTSVFCKAECRQQTNLSTLYAYMVNIKSSIVFALHSKDDANYMFGNYV